MDASTLLWNGNQASGLSQVTSFLENLPATTHSVEGIDAQPIPGTETIVCDIMGEKSDQNGHSFSECWTDLKLDDRLMDCGWCADNCQCEVRVFTE